jgi:hypothetical protein
LLLLLLLFVVLAAVLLFADLRPDFIFAIKNIPPLAPHPI